MGSASLGEDNPQTLHPFVAPKGIFILGMATSSSFPDRMSDPLNFGFSQTPFASCPLVACYFEFPFAPRSIPVPDNTNIDDIDLRAP